MFFDGLKVKVFRQSVKVFPQGTQLWKIVLLKFFTFIKVQNKNFLQNKNIIYLCLRLGRPLDWIFFSRCLSSYLLYCTNLNGLTGGTRYVCPNLSWVSEMLQGKICWNLKRRQKIFLCMSPVLRIQKRLESNIWFSRTQWFYLRESPTKK